MSTLEPPLPIEPEALAAELDKLALKHQIQDALRRADERDAHEMAKQILSEITKTSLPPVTESEDEEEGEGEEQVDEEEQAKGKARERAQRDHDLFGDEFPDELDETEERRGRDPRVRPTS